MVTNWRAVPIRYAQKLIICPPSGQPAWRKVANNRSKRDVLQVPHDAGQQVPREGEIVEEDIPRMAAT